MVTLQWYIWLSLGMFMIGIFGFLTRRNIVMMFLSIELMLNGVNLSLVSFSSFLEDLRGHILTFFIIAVAAAEAAIGLAILITVFRNRATVQIEEIKEMKG